MKKTIIKSLTAAAVIAVILLVISACGKKEVTVKITDSGTSTEVKAMTGQTIKDVLAQAEITIGDKDETDPSLDTKLTEDINEIIVKRCIKVTVIRGDSKEEIEIVGGNVKEAIEKSGLKIGNGEMADASLNSQLKDGMTITIAKAIKVTITADGKTKNVEAIKGSKVQDVLAIAEITLGEDDQCSEKPDTEVTDGMKITIQRVEYREETVKETIEFKTEYQTDKTLAKGTSKVIQEGENGEKEVTYRIKIIDGKEIGRDSEPLSEKIIKEPVNKIIANGSGASSSSSSNQGSGGKTVVSKIKFPNCDDESHGYYEVHYSDGSVEYIEY
ncbi:MAG: G5 domain-containing protein [Clostridiales bacterium]|nr:G5 domain-containing protein [Clostridiales bacterium]